ncbi:MAG: hypothetical protein FJ050_11795 [Cyanobacteria bacterium M_surface_7_m2_040]|nr:hypothetical protein [Cyanobacteria bacterium M_surface_7_m2_040]
MVLPLPWSAAVAAPQPGRCAPPADLTSLSGVWQAEALAHVSGGVAASRQRLQLQVGADGRVRGQRDWAAVRTGAGAVQGRNRKGQPAFQEVEPLIGWIDPRSCRVLLVETEDNGQLSGSLRRDAGGPVLELAISQSGRGAVVVFADFRWQTSTQAGATPKP